MAMPTRILIKVNLILIQYRMRKGSATGCKHTENFSRMRLVSFKPRGVGSEGAGEPDNSGHVEKLTIT
jgi:hypothetical protein